MKDKSLLPWFEGKMGFRYLPETGLSHLHHICVALGLLSHSFRMKDMIALHVYNIKDMVWGSKHASSIKVPINIFSRAFPHTS